MDELEAKLERVLKLSNVMSESGRQYVTAQTQFVAGLWEISSYFANETDITPGGSTGSSEHSATTAHLNKLIQSVQETIKLQNATIDSASKTVANNLQSFLKEDMKQMRDTRGYFNKISNDLDGALNKNAAATKSRPNEVEDATNLLTATQSCFRYTTVDYVYQVRYSSSYDKITKRLLLSNLVFL